MTHYLRIAPEYFEAVLSGAKTFEVRREDDKTFAVGDMLILREWDFNRLPEPVRAWYGALSGDSLDSLSADAYTGCECTVHVTYVLRDFGGLEPGYVVMGIRLERQKGAISTNDYPIAIDIRGNAIRLDWCAGRQIKHLHLSQQDKVPSRTHTFWISEIEVNSEIVGVGLRTDGTDQPEDCDVDMAMFRTRDEAKAFALDYLANKKWRVVSKETK